MKQNILFTFNLKSFSIYFILNIELKGGIQEFSKVENKTRACDDIHNIIWYWWNRNKKLCSNYTTFSSNWKEILSHKNEI